MSNFNDEKTDSIAYSDWPHVDKGKGSVVNRSSAQSKAGFIVRSSFQRSEYEEDWTNSHIQKNSTYLDLGDDSFTDWLENKPKWYRNYITALYKRLELNNRGTHNGIWKNREVVRRMDDWYLCHAIANRLEMKDREKRTLWRNFKELDMRSFKKYGKEKCFLVPYCICVLIHNGKQENDKWKVYPGKKYNEEIDFDGLFRPISDLRHRHLLFEQIADESRWEPNEVRSCLEKVRQKTAGGI